ncbi:MAG: hypothetical protein ACT4P4_15835 [Betaproteobacteria bacterium]
MNAAAVSRVLSLIPERTPRALSGSLFTSEEAARAERADRVQYVARFLGWLSPLNPITKDDQRFLGLLATHVRPEHAAEDDEALEDAAEDALYDEPPASRPGTTLASPSIPIVSGGGS